MPMLDPVMMVAIIVGVIFLLGALMGLGLLALTTVVSFKSLAVNHKILESLSLHTRTLENAVRQLDEMAKSQNRLHMEVFKCNQKPSQPPSVRL